VEQRKEVYIQVLAGYSTKVQISDFLLPARDIVLIGGGSLPGGLELGGW